jgi:hypothetical protein
VTYFDLVFRPYKDAMNTKIVLATMGIGIGFAALATLMNYGTSGQIPRNGRGMIVGTMAHLRGVKLKAVAKLPDYEVNNGDIQKADRETASAIIVYAGTTQLDILMGNLPAE